MKKEDKTYILIKYLIWGKLYDLSPEVTVNKIHMSLWAQLIYLLKLEFNSNEITRTLCSFETVNIKEIPKIDIVIKKIKNIIREETHDHTHSR